MQLEVRSRRARAQKRRGGAEGLSQSGIRPSEAPCGRGEAAGGAHAR